MAIAKGFASVAFRQWSRLFFGWAGGKDGRAFPLRISLFLDQIVFSASNFLLTISIAQAYDNSSLAGYGIGLSLALSMQSAQRGIYIVPFALRSTRIARKGIAGRVAEHIIMLTILFPFLLIAAFALSKTTMQSAPSTILASVFCALLYFGLEFERMALIKCGHIWAPLICSILYGAVVGLVALLARQLSFETSITILCVFCVAKSIFVLLFVSRPRWSWGYRMLKRDLQIYAPWSVMGALYYSGYNQVPFLVLAATREPAQAAAFVAIRSLTQPLQIVIRSLDIVDKHSLKDESAGTADGIRAAFWRTFISYSCIGLAAVVVMAVFRQPILRLAYDTKFQAFPLLLPLLGLFSAILAITLPVESIVNISRKFNSSTLWRLLSALFGAGLAFVLSPIWGAYGAALATVFGAIFALVGSMYALRRVIFKSSLGANEHEQHKRVETIFR
jgi:O-antigen/teichoic acid export membrane protein